MSRKVKMSETSLEAHRSLKPDEIRAMYNKIIATLKILGSGTYEEISDYLGLKDRNSISRRLKELCPADENNPKGLGLIYKTADRRLTKRHCPATVYKLVTNGEQSAEPEKAIEKDTAHYAKEIIQLTMQL